MSTTSEDTLDFEESHGTTKSGVWSFYIKSTTDEGKVVSECKYCQKVYIAGSSHGTSNMRRHLRSQCPSRNSPEVLEFFAKSTSGGAVRSVGCNQVEYREALALSIIQHEYPFSYVEDEGTRKVHSVLNSYVKHISRNIAKADILNVFHIEKRRLLESLQSLPGKVSLTSDFWTSITTDGYMCITAHFIDKDCNLHKKILNFVYVEAPHTGPAISKEFGDTKDENKAFLEFDLCSLPPFPRSSSLYSSASSSS
ncbi:hypothetical protein RJ640_022090 [Escallonia rubra]|uniref:BED-type domain-containing protein n=1 Tax=Escallonia rubra TaxID=112253 RepID=A0AA88QRZ5_9ASTE|nr:hypothetical protein RJ640_022090 [Escallonia rubra]